jgi:hypothetical protein
VIGLGVQARREAGADESYPERRAVASHRPSLAALSYLVNVAGWIQPSDEATARGHTPSLTPALPLREGEGDFLVPLHCSGRDLFG